MNRLNAAKRVQVLTALVEGNSVHAVVRMTGVAKSTVHFMDYNMCRVHKTLRVSPAMEAGIATDIWSLEELIGLLSSTMEKAA